MSLVTIFIALIVFVSILLILVIMVQNPKGGGLSSAIGGSGGSQIVGGVKNTGNFLDKSTWTLAMLLVVLILLSNTIIKNYNTLPNQSPVEKTLEAPENLNNTIPEEKSEHSDTTEDSNSSSSSSEKTIE